MLYRIREKAYQITNCTVYEVINAFVRYDVQ